MATLSIAKQARKRLPVPNQANVSRLGYVGSKPGEKRDSDSWFTPTPYIEAAHEALGGIDFDPFSSDVANKTVKAKRYYTVDDDSLSTDWPRVKSVWMNPPYSAGLCGKAANRFVDNFNSGAFKNGIVLVNNATDTKWFHELARHATAICFTDHRIAFWNADGKQKSGNTRGQCFLFFSSTKSNLGVKRFKEAFGKFGLIVDVR
jgi:phage N-6-adenine-methyltransferase